MQRTELQYLLFLLEDRCSMSHLMMQNVVTFVGQCRDDFRGCALPAVSFWFLPFSHWMCNSDERA